MGSWQLEVGKMFLYVMIPVAAFHFFNKPEYFHDWIASTRLQTYPAVDSAKNHEIIKQAKVHHQNLMRRKKFEGNENP